MRIRVKFTKTGCLKYIGHLDVMRYFQKAFRRAEIPVSLSEGFSPHMLMSFAAPLGVGKTSSGEYFDVDLKQDMDTEEVRERLQAQMAEGISVVGVIVIPEDKANKCMTLVAAADYTVALRKGKVQLPENWKEKLQAFLDQPSVVVMRKTKKSEQETDILPWIYKMRPVMLDEKAMSEHPSGAEADPVAFRMVLSSGSVSNLKPDLVLETFAAYAGFELPEFSLLIHRNDIMADIGKNGKRKLVPLGELRKQS
ncbi:MAG: TIGR03936 family radical SAM-associated protein [Eubacteriales bacterium]|nr:TIGR03936 family radical SAM-associated protein [Eubacteriales bacterium]